MDDDDDDCGDDDDDGGGGGDDDDDDEMSCWFSKIAQQMKYWNAGFFIKRLLAKAARGMFFNVP